MKKLFILFCTVSSFSVVAAEIGEQTEYVEAKIEKVTQSSELSDRRAEVTYFMLRSMAKDPERMKLDIDKSLDVFSDVEKATTQKINAHRAELCKQLFNLDLNNMEYAVNYWFEVNNEFDKFKAQAERDALSKVPVELLNIVQDFNSVETVTITPESILANDPKQWIDDQKFNCNEVKK